MTLVLDRNAAVFKVGSLEINIDTRIIWHEGTALNFEPKEVAFLICLGRYVNLLVPRDYIIQYVWGQSANAHGHSIDNAAAGIRKILKSRKLCWMFETIRGKGFILHDKKPCDSMSYLSIF